MEAIKWSRIGALILLMLTTTFLLTSNNVNAQEFINISDISVESTDEVTVSEPENIDNALTEEERQNFTVTAGASNIMVDILTDEESVSTNINGANLYAGAVMQHAEAIQQSVTNSESIVNEEYVSRTEDDSIAIEAVDHVQMYVSVGTLNVRECPDLQADILDTLSINDTVKVIGRVANEDNGYVMIETDNGETSGFVAEEYLSDQELMVKQVPVSTLAFNSFIGCTYDCYGYRLTYYNLNMSKCITEMRSLGYNDEVWVSPQGYKMMGSKIMCAGKYPKGTIVSCQLGDCIVVDHGDFEADYGKMALDICTVWD